MARRHVFPSRTRSKRATSWGFGPGGTALNAFSSSSTQFIGSSVNLAQGVLEATLVRLRGTFTCIQRSATTAGDGFAGAFGIGLATKEAITGGVTTVPEPLTDVEWGGWVYHRMFSMHNSTTGANLEKVEWEVDSKAMRKWDEQMGLYAIMEVVEIGGASLDVFFDSRILIKLT